MVDAYAAPVANCPRRPDPAGRLEGEIMSYTMDTGVRVPMRDGTELDTNVWRSAGEGPWRTLLVRLLYGKDVPPCSPTAPIRTYSSCSRPGTRWCSRTSAARFKPEGPCSSPMVHEPEDGADTVAWLMTRSWCDGNIGSYGPSYFGFVPEDASHRPCRGHLDTEVTGTGDHGRASGTNSLSGSVRRSRCRPAVGRCGRRSGCGAAPGNTTCR